MLALAFLLMIGFLLVVEGLPDTLHVEVPKGYLYFAMAFSFFVELINIRVRKKEKAMKKEENGQKQ
jgi:predicted tellurium resistance membrane protein TerC